MPRPHKITPYEADLLRKISETQTKLLRANSELRMKTLAVERLECLVRTRCEHIDTLNAKLEQTRTTNQQLELQNECLIRLITTPQQQPSLTQQPT